MPHVQITWVEGRTPEMKRKIADRITAALIEDGRAKRENIHVSFHDVPATNYAKLVFWLRIKSVRRNGRAMPFALALAGAPGEHGPLSLRGLQPNKEASTWLTP